MLVGSYCPRQEHGAGGSYLSSDKSMELLF